MPYRWLTHPDNPKTAAAEESAAVFHPPTSQHPADNPVTTAPPDQVIALLELWPHRSLPMRGFVWVIALTAGALALPLLAVTGSAVWWGLLPFALLTIWGLWFALMRSYRAATLSETLVLTRDHLSLRRHDPGHADRIWHTNPYWVRSQIRPGPVEDYLTLTDGQREVELGAFLSPPERLDLHHSLCRALACANGLASVPNTFRG